MLSIYTYHIIGNCLGPGFTETIPATQEWSKYSTAVLKPGDQAIYSTLSFACNGTLQSLTIPSVVRASGFNMQFSAFISVWRFSETGHYRVREFRGDVRVSGFGVLQTNVTMIGPMEIHAKDVLAFRLPGQMYGNSIPLLFKLGTSPGTFIPVVSANFTASSGPVSGEECI